MASIPDIFPAPTRTASSSASEATEPPRATRTYAPWPTVPVAKTVGLIVPRPFQPWGILYSNVSYTFGVNEVGDRPAPIVGGWLRVLTALVMMPDYSISVLGFSGTEDLSSAISRPYSDSTLCGCNAIDNYVPLYQFKFSQPGWHMFVVNQTWVRPTIVNDTCILPFLQGKSFFASHFISISPLPTGLIPGPAETHTLWKNVSQVEPTTLPFPNHHGTARERLGLGLGITFGVLALIAMILMLVWFRRRNFREREERYFGRLSATDQAAFLHDNPQSFLNPNRETFWTRFWLERPLNFIAWPSYLPAFSSSQRSDSLATTYTVAQPPRYPTHKELPPLPPHWRAPPYQRPPPGFRGSHGLPQYGWGPRPYAYVPPPM